MNDSDKQSSARWQRVTIPLIAAAVAVVQITLAHTTTLTPWKGGGFGMFSAIDNSKMRFFSARAATEDGREIALHMDHALRKKNAALRKKFAVRPTPEKLEAMGRMFVSERFVEADPSGERAFLPRLYLENKPERRPAVEGFADTPFYYWVPEKEIAGLPYPAVSIKELRLRALKLRYDMKSGRLETEPLVDEVTVRS